MIRLFIVAEALDSVYELLRWLQPEATGAGGGGGSPAAPPGGGCAGQVGILLLMMLVFYFLLIRPQQKRQREHDDMLKALRRGAIVRTTGGLRGEIFAITDRDVTLIIADKVKVNVLRSHVAGLEPGPDEGKKEQKEPASKEAD